MFWGLGFIFRWFFTDQARRDHIRTILTEMNKSDAVEVKKISKKYNPPYEFTIRAECSHDKHNYIEMSFSTSTPYEKCHHTCSCGTKFEFTALKADSKHEWRTTDFISDIGSESFLWDDIAVHNYKVLKACPKALKDSNADNN